VSLASAKDAIHEWLWHLITGVESPYISAQSSSPIGLRCSLEPPAVASTFESFVSKADASDEVARARSTLVPCTTEESAVLNVAASESCFVENNFAEFS